MKREENNTLIKWNKLTDKKRVKKKERQRLARCPAAWQGSSRLNTRQSKSLKNFNKKANSNVLDVFDISVELQSNSKKYFSFLVDEFVPSLCTL